MTERTKAKFAYPCTECNGDAMLGFSNFRKSNRKKPLIGKDERLCRKCARKRGLTW